jgi:magnesium-transporting ATPase (P-type)
VICSDKTGTLTTNQMTAVSLLLPAEQGSFEELEVTGLSYDPTDGEVVGRPDLAESHAAAFAAAAVCALCNDAQLAKDPKTGQFVRVGEPTEAALKVLCEKLGAPKSLDASPEAKQAGPWHRASLAWAGAYERTATLEFDRGRKSMSVVCRRNGSDARLFVKGAPDSVLARCSRVLDPATGGPRKLEDGERAELAAKVTAMAGRPLRCLALAYTDDLPPELQAYEGSDEDADLPASVWKSNIQPDFNVRVFECFDTSTSAVLRELAESNRFIQKSAESTWI